MKGLLLWIALAGSAVAGCVSFADAQKHVGDEVCIEGKVVNVGRSPRSGTQFLNFCEDYKHCEFTVVVFAKDLPHVGDVQALAGKDIKIYGKVRAYKGQAEIILNDARQLKGEKFKLPPAPKNFDAANRGHYSAGQFSEAQAKKPRKKRQPHGPSETEQPSDPESN